MWDGVSVPAEAHQEASSVKGKRYRFFYHYRRCDKKMSVHFRGACYPCEHVKCAVPCETKRNKRQPFLVLQGYAEGVSIVNGTAYIV